MTNTKIAQKYFELSNKRDLTGIEELLTGTTTYSSPNVGVFLGVEQIMKMKRGFYGSFKEMNWDVREVKEVREGVVEFDFVFTGTTNDGDVIERPAADVCGSKPIRTRATNDEVAEFILGEAHRRGKNPSSRAWCFYALRELGCQRQLDDFHHLFPDFHRK